MQILPAASFLTFTGRASGIALEEAGRLSFHPLRALELVAPGLFGWEQFNRFLAYDEGLGRSATPWLATPYLGSLAVLLAPFAFAPGRMRRAACALAAMAAVALVLAFGRHTPVFGAYFRCRFRGPTTSGTRPSSCSWSRALCPCLRPWA